MGKKKDEEAEVEPEDDAPIVKDLKGLIEKHWELEKEYDREVNLLISKYNKLQAPFLEKRLQTLRGDDPSKVGTPSLEGFWLQAMLNHSQLKDAIEEWDEPVLRYLENVAHEFLHEENIDGGFRINFHFSENPYFTNKVLWMEYHMAAQQPFTSNVEPEEIKACAIDWKPGQDVTTEVVKKKKTGGGARKNKQAGKAKEEARKSFFRLYFQSLKEGMTGQDLNSSVEDVLEFVGMDDMDEDDDDLPEGDELIELLMDESSDLGRDIKDSLIPFAVKWYTGEAASDSGSDSDDSDDDDDDDDDDDSEEDSAPRKKEPRGRGPPRK